MSHEYIPNNLKMLRKRAGLRQQDVADKLGIVAFDRISRWEKGLCYPSVVNLFKLTRIYNVDHPRHMYGDLWTSIHGDWFTPGQDPQQSS